MAMERENYMTDSKGRLVPKEMVPEIDQARDSLVRELVAAAQALQVKMATFKSRAMGDVQAFVELSAEKYDVSLGGQKGNVSLLSYDGRYKVQVAISEYLSFDERLKAAKKLVDECLTTWAEDSRAEIRTIIMDAFQVDKEGQVNTARILGLRRLAINDPKWLRAMDAIGDSMQVVGSKSYFRVYQRAGQDDGWMAISLDLAAL